MFKSFCDFETRSLLSVNAVGAWKYVEHPSTYPLMFAYKTPDGIRQWLEYKHGRDMPDDWGDLVRNPDVQFHAHNAGFEIAVYETICVGQWGWLPIDRNRWRDTAAKASYANQPRALGNLCLRLGTNERKDKYGKELLDNLSVPQKCVKANRHQADVTYLVDGIDETETTFRVESTASWLQSDKPPCQITVERERMTLLQIDAATNKVHVERAKKPKPHPARSKCRKPGPIRTDSISYLRERNTDLFELESEKGKRALYYWNNDSKLLADLAKYNRQDIIAEEDADRKLPELPEFEQRCWELDFRINERGIPIDRKVCEGVKQIFAVEAEICDRQISEIAIEDDGRPEKKQVTACTQRERICEWVNERVNFGDSLNKDFVDPWLDQYDKWQQGKCEPPHGIKNQHEAERVYKVLRLRQIAAGTGVKKYWSALDFAQDDDRVRGQMLYHGAATGRWKGKGIQPHNFVREGIPEEIFFISISRGDHREFNQLARLFGYNVMGLLRKCTRGLIRASEGKQLIVSDFAGIESRVLQWMAGNKKALQLFRQGADMYVHAAADIFDIPYDEMMEPDPDKPGKLRCKKEYKDKRQVGKIAVLALGYGMGAEKYQGTCEGYGVEIDLEFAQLVVRKWRNANPLVTDLWYRVERACKAVIKSKNVKAKIDNILRIYWDKRGYLCIELPSGRVLRYYKARIDKFSGQIEYLDGGKSEGTFFVQTYGGKLIENIDQAISRDLLVNSAFLADDAGLNLVFHVHDELVCEELVANTKAYAMLHKCMESLPAWAEGIPLAAETYQSLRYTK